MSDSNIITKLNQGDSPIHVLETSTRAIRSWLDSKPNGFEEAFEGCVDTAQRRVTSDSSEYFIVIRVRGSAS